MGRRLQVRRLLAPLRIRDFRLLWFGQTISLVGNGMFIVALTWEALRIGGGASALAVVLLAYVVPTSVFLLLGGIISDRLPRRKTMMACDLVQAAVIGAVALVASQARLETWHLVVVAACAGIAAGFFLPASTAFVPEVTPRESLVPANSLLALSRLSASRLAGPALGGVLVASWGAGVAFAIDAATFLVSAVCLRLIRYAAQPRDPGDEPRGRLKEDFLEGIRYCRRRRWLWMSLAAFAVLNIGVGAPLAALIPVYVKEHLGLDARALGALFAAEGASAVVATFFAGNLPEPRRPVVAAHLSFASAGVAIAAMALTSRLLVAAAALCVVAFLLELGNVYWASALQALIPNRLLGRVSSVDWLVSGSLLPAGIAVVGPATAAFGVASVFVAGGALTATVSGLAAMAVRAGFAGQRGAGTPDAELVQESEVAVG